jgi:hypothetical protein
MGQGGPRSEDLRGEIVGLRIEVRELREILNRALQELRRPAGGEGDRGGDRRDPREGVRREGGR